MISNGDRFALGKRRLIAASFHVCFGKKSSCHFYFLVVKVSLPVSFACEKVNRESCSITACAMSTT